MEEEHQSNIEFPYPDSHINSIIHGDTTFELKKFKSNSIHCVVMDPPFGTEQKNMGYDDSLKYVLDHIDGWFKEIRRIMVKHGCLFIYVPTEFVDIWIFYVRRYFNYNNLITGQSYMNNRFKVKNNFGFDAQHIIFASKDKQRNFNEVDWIPTSKEWLNDKRNTNKKLFTYNYPNFIDPNIIHTNVKSNNEIKLRHPNEKNPLLIQYFIEMATNKGEIVADFFSGYGTTIISALSCGRKGIGIDKNAEYYKNSLQRIEDFNNEKEIVNKNTLETCIKNYYKK